MQLSVGEILSRVTTVSDMIRAFQDEDHCRRLLEAMVWPNGRICPACGYRRSIALMGREKGKRARPGLYQCSSGICRFQFTVTTRTPLHATKLPLQVWLSGLWPMLQSDKGTSSIRLTEALGVSQPTAWRMGHALRQMGGREQALDGVVEIDSLYVGGEWCAGKHGRSIPLAAICGSAPVLSAGFPCSPYIREEARLYSALRGFSLQMTPTACLES